MKRTLIFAATVVLAGLFCGRAWAYSNVYKWVKDKAYASDRVLKESQAMRVVNLPEGQVLPTVRQVLTEDLFLALAEYHKTKHQQDAETTADTVLPEEVIGKQEVDLVDEDNGDFRFLLQVRLRAYGNRTRVMAKAYAMYRVHDVDAESEANSETAGSSVEIKVKGDPNALVGIGPMFIVPIEGRLADYRIQPLPDAPERAAQMVRSFLYLLDQRLAKRLPATTDGE